MGTSLRATLINVSITVIFILTMIVQSNLLASVSPINKFYIGMAPISVINVARNPLVAAFGFRINGFNRNVDEKELRRQIELQEALKARRERNKTTF